MDPQGRLLLEQTGLALLDAKGRQGQDTEAATGVYVGVMHMEFIQHLAGEPHHLKHPSCHGTSGPAVLHYQQGSARLQ